MKPFLPSGDRVPSTRLPSSSPTSPVRRPWQFPRFPALTTASLVFAHAAQGAAGASPSALDAGFDWAAFLGPFHTVTLHLPIGLLSAAALFELLHWKYPRRFGGQPTRIMLGAALASGCVAVFLGLMRAAGGGFDPETLQDHRFGGFALLVLLTVTLGIGWYGSQNPAATLPTKLFRGSLAACLVVLGWTGHLGGNLTHGSTYLTANAPIFVKRALGQARPKAPLVPSSALTARAADGGGDPQAALYTTRIGPLLTERCQSCHGPEKHKGNYRLDSREAALKAGESGTSGITPGEPSKSEVVRRLLLPPDHDDVMPPSGKKPLTPEEILAVAHWIQAGASFAPLTPPITNAPPAPAAH